MYNTKNIVKNYEKYLKDTPYNLIKYDPKDDVYSFEDSDPYDDRHSPKGSWKRQELIDTFQDGFREGLQVGVEEERRFQQSIDKNKFQEGYEAGYAQALKDMATKSHPSEPIAIPESQHVLSIML